MAQYTSKIIGIQCIEKNFQSNYFATIFNLLTVTNEAYYITILENIFKMWAADAL